MADTPTTRRSEPPRPPVTVYVVEDHEGVRSQLVDLVNRADGMVVVGSSGEARVACAEVEAARPHVAVIDGRIVDVDGLDVCRRLKAVCPEVACVIVTAGVSADVGPADAEAAGADAFLLKQISRFPLVEIIEQLAFGRAKR